jgi:hypothetical protein
VEVKIGIHDAALQRVDRKVDQWVNRGVGIWAAVAVVFSLVQFWKK